jgi:hypothetical protein
VEKMKNRVQIELVNNDGFELVKIEIVKFVNNIISMAQSSTKSMQTNLHNLFSLKEAQMQESSVPVAMERLWSMSICPPKNAKAS